MTTISDQATLSVAKVQAFATGGGTAQAESAADAVSEIVQWLRYFTATSEDGHAAELLDGARAFVIEAVAYVSLGLGRAAISAVRGQIDSLLCYTYFHDHPAEWELVERTGDGFKLRSAIYRYHEDTNIGFKKRLAMIEDRAEFTLRKTYQILSAHIHGQTTLTIPQTNTLDEVVLSDVFVTSIVDLQRHTSVALSNFLTAVYAPHWPELPVEVVKRVRDTLQPKQRESFFAD